MALAPILSAPMLTRNLATPQTIARGAMFGPAAIGLFAIDVSEIGGNFGTRSLSARCATRSLEGSTMPYAGDYLPYCSPGESQPYSIDFANQLGGDSIASVASSLTAASNKPLSFFETEADASANSVGPPSFGTACTQGVGLCQPNVAYALSFTVITAGGRTLINYGHIYCQAVI